MFPYPMMCSASTKELIDAQMRDRLPWWIRNKLNIPESVPQDAPETEPVSVPDPASDLQSDSESDPDTPSPTSGITNLLFSMTKRLQRGIYIQVPGPVVVPQTPQPVHEAPSQPEVQALQPFTDEPETADRSEHQPPPPKRAKRQRSKKSLKRSFAPATKRTRLNPSPRPSSSSQSRKESDPAPVLAKTIDENESSEAGNDVDDGGDFEVDYIFDVRGRGGKKEFLVKWKGYSRAESTWEPEANLCNCHEALCAFNEKRKIKRSR